MFEFLDREDTDALTGGVYYAIRLISHLNQIKDVKLGYNVEEPFDTPTEAQRLVCDRILNEISLNERSTWAQLSKPVAERYIAILAARLQKTLKERLRYDEKRGDSLLEKLRTLHRRD